MQFLQVSKNGKLLEIPLIWKFGTDFNCITNFELIQVNVTGNNLICIINDCFRSQPLVMHDQKWGRDNPNIYEFDILVDYNKYKKEGEQYRYTVVHNDDRYSLKFHGYLEKQYPFVEDRNFPHRIPDIHENLGSIFRKDNFDKFPDLANDSMNKIKKYYGQLF